jgi:hypothetical protein
VDPIGFLPAFIHSLEPSVQTPIQSTKPEKVPLHLFHRAQKPGHHSLVSVKCFQAH